MWRSRTLCGVWVGVVCLVLVPGLGCPTEPSEFNGDDDDDSPTVSTESIVITEIMANPNRVSDLKGEWIELFNPGSSAVDLGGWSITDAGDSSFTIEDLTISAREHVVLGISNATEENGGVDLDYPYPEDFTLGNNAESLALRDSGGGLVDFVSYDKAPDGASLSLDPTKYDTDLNDKAENFCASRFSQLPGGDLGTPGALNDVCFISASPGDVIITEIMANPDPEYGSRGWFFELYNTTSSVVKLDGWTLGDGSGDTHTISSGGDLEIKGKSYVVLGAWSNTTENGGVDVDYSFGSALVLSDSTDTISLSADGTVVDTVTYGTTGFPPNTEGTSIQLDTGSFDATLNDDGGNWCESTTEMASSVEKGTPGDTNISCGS